MARSAAPADVADRGIVQDHWGGSAVQYYGVLAEAKFPGKKRFMPRDDRVAPSAD